MMTGDEFPQPSSIPDPMGPPPASPSLPSEGSFQGHAGYTENGPPHCTGCSQPILDQFILQVQGHTWHARCLQCAVCHVTLTHTCYSSHNQLYCQDDFFRLFGSHCSACKANIPPTEVVRRAHDNVYHLNCFRCSVCARELRTGDEFYLGTGGHLLCQTDYASAKEKEEQGENRTPDLRPSSPPIKPPSTATDQSQALDLTEYYTGRNSAPKRKEMEEIASRLNMELTDVRAWFRHKRAKTRRKGDNPSNCTGPVGNNRVISPPGGYPLPIVNLARSPGRLPDSACQPFQVAPPLLPIGHAPFNQTPLPATNNFQAWEELWSNDFVPPNVDLDPNHLKNGEVIRLGVGGSALLPHHPITTPGLINNNNNNNNNISGNLPCPLPPIASPAISQHHPSRHNPHHLNHHNQQQQQQQHNHNNQRHNNFQPPQHPPCNMSSNNVEHGIGCLPWVS